MMSKLTKKVLAMLLVLVMGLSMVGCGGKTETPTDTTTTTEEAATEEAATEEATVATTEGAGADATAMEMWTFVDMHATFFTTMAAKWNAANPDRQLNLTATVLPYDDMHNKLQMALQSGEGAPDICDVEVGKFPNFMMGEPQLEPLNDVVEPYIGKVVQSRLDLYAKDGNYYGFDYHVGATVMFYNTEILDAAGVDYTTIKTWDDYLAAGKIVKEKTGKFMGTLETTTTWLTSTMVAEQGADFVNEDGTPNLNSAEMKKAIDTQLLWQAEGIAEVCPGGQPDTEEGFGYINTGNVASFSMPFWFTSRFLNYMPDVKGKFVIAPNPVFEEGQPQSVGLGGTGTVVTKTAADVQLAKDFVAFAKLSDEGNVEIWNLLGFDPINTNVWTDTAVTQNPDNQFVQYFKNFPFDALLEIKDGIALHKSVEASPTINNIFGTITMLDIYENAMDPQEALDAAQEQAESEMGL